MKLIYILVLVSLITACTKKEKTQEVAEKIDMNYNFLVGTYATDSTQGIYKATLNKDTATIKKVSSLENASFLTFGNNAGQVFAVKENSQGELVHLSFQGESLTALDSVSTLGKHPCHVSIDKTGKFIAVANYSSGNFCLYAIKENGEIGDMISTIQHKGSGVNKARQEGPHVHSVYFSPKNNQLFIADLGLDKLYVYDFNEATGAINLSQEIDVEPGAGPRHLTFSSNGKFAYLIQELSSAISVLQNENEQWKITETHSTLPDGFEGNNACADIHLSPDGKFLYGSNRFHDSIAVYSVNQKTGGLTLVSHHDCGGKTPRNFAISPDGAYVLVANQDSGTISFFKRDKETGKLIPQKQELEVQKAVCIKFY